MKAQVWTLGISASHNGSACVFRDDECVVAVQEERISRKKRDRILPSRRSSAIEYCLKAAHIRPTELDAIGISVQGHSHGATEALRRNASLAGEIRCPIHVVPHHFAHALSAYCESGFDVATIVVADGAGSPFDDLFDSEQAVLRPHDPNGWETLSIYAASRRGLVPIEKHVTPGVPWLGKSTGGLAHYASLGGMYSAAADLIFGDPMAAGKVMALAGLGEPVWPPDCFVRFENDRLLWPEVLPDITAPYRTCGAHGQLANLAASVQQALRVTLLAIVDYAHDVAPNANLCCAGGVWLNCDSNHHVIWKSRFSNFFVQPAADDSGACLGAAYYAIASNRALPSRQVTDFGGQRYSHTETAAALRSFSGLCRLQVHDPFEWTVDALSHGKFIGWFWEDSELGPRALGHRSILADPRIGGSKPRLDRVKGREAFRPYGCAIEGEATDTWFDRHSRPSGVDRFMLRTCEAGERTQVLAPLVVHADATTRIQTVRPSDDDSTLRQLLQLFEAATDIPFLVNTSLNSADEPLCETPADALAFLQTSSLDACVLDGSVVVKE